METFFTKVVQHKRLNPNIYGINDVFFRGAVVTFNLFCNKKGGGCSPGAGKHWPVCGLSPGFQQVHVPENLSDHFIVFNECNHAHRTRAPGTHQGIDLVDLLDQLCPVAPELPVGQLRLQDAGDDVVRIGFLFVARPD